MTDVALNMKINALRHECVDMLYQTEDVRLLTALSDNLRRAVRSVTKKKQPSKATLEFFENIAKLADGDLAEKVVESRGFQCREITL